MSANQVVREVRKINPDDLEASLDDEGIGHEIENGDHISRKLISAPSTVEDDVIFKVDETKVRKKPSCVTGAGVGLFAMCDVTAGELIFQISDPLVSILHNGYLADYCYECF